MQVDVGVVTGQNDFFVMRREDVEQRRLQAHVVPLAGRSTQLAGLTFGRDEWARLSREGHPMHLLALPRTDEVSEAVRAYVAEGEARGFHTGFKCRNRSPWYSVPSVHVPDAFFLRQIDGCPRVVLDAAGATCTDTLHRVRFRPGVDPVAVTLAVQSSLTFAFAEVTGRSYGGGVLTFEPSEAERLPLPLGNAGALDLAWADARLRAGRLTEVLDAHDRTLLVEGLGLSAGEAATLRGVWEKLRDRRRGRRRRASATSPA
jgi:adenine-specific DNA methylase